MKYLILTLIFVNSLLFSKAVAAAGLNESVGVFTRNFNGEDFLPPELTNAKLDKKINLSFRKTKLSKVLLMLSNYGDLNIVFPKELDREISIQMTGRRLGDALREVLDISGLKYVFKGNAVIVSEHDLSEVAFQTIEILYSKAEDISSTLNNNLFNQLAVSQPEGATKPYSFIVPNSNSVVVVGNDEQVDVALSFIKELDKKPYIQVYKLSYLDADEARKILDFELNNAYIKYKLYNQNMLMLKGAELEVKKAVELLSRFEFAHKDMSKESESSKKG